MRKAATTVGVAMLALLAGGCIQGQWRAEETVLDTREPPAAERLRVALHSTEGDSAAGMLEIVPIEDGLHISGTVTGLPMGGHGFHIHEFGDCSKPSVTSGDHFNPDARRHGASDAPEHHAGDLGNVEADASGSATVNIRASGINLEQGASNSVFARSLVVHTTADDFKTQPTGNAGEPLACGVIQ